MFVLGLGGRQKIVPNAKPAAIDAWGVTSIMRPHWEGAILVHWMRAVFGYTLMALLAAPALGQYTSTSEKLLINAVSASTWNQGNTSIVQIIGPLTIATDNLKLSADRAVVWLTPQPGGLLGEQQAEIVLIGNASLRSPENHLTRTGPRLLVTAVVRGTIRLSAQDHESIDESSSDLFHEAQAIRFAPQELETPNPTTDQSQFNSATTESSSPTSRPVLPPPASPYGEIEVHAANGQQLALADGSIVDVLTGGVTLTQAQPKGDFLELLSERAVIFTDQKIAGSKNTGVTDIGRKATAAYLEGDVRINFTPIGAHRAEQRLTVDRAYYDFIHDRAVLTDVILHTIDPYSQIPVIIRAQTMHQLAQGEYTAKSVDLTTSSFAVPTFAVHASDAYMHEVTQPWGEVDNNFVARNDTANFFGVPTFYFPSVAGTVSSDPFPLRNFNTQNSQKFGFGVTTDWGLFESAGQPHPADLDVSYRLDYFSSRGEGGGFEGTYSGGYITDTTREPWDFEGDFKSYIIQDRGIDTLGGERTDVDPPTDVRGRFLWEHQHFFPDDWQVQIRAGYVSDPTFLEEYYQPDFDDGMPYNASFYVKHQKDTEALTFLAETDTTRFVTDADQQAEQFDVERMPELGYHRIGDSLADDNLTFFSDNSASRLRFQNSSATLAQQGFGPGLSPGIPNTGFTGTPDTSVYRGDTRQELDWPLAIGQIKVVPYVLGRVTTYSDSPADDAQTRVYTGGGFRMSTAFWKVDDSAESDLFDIHRVRTVIQPEVNLYSAGTSVDRSQLLIYDPDVDPINDISAAQVALHERWQTMRGGPGGWRSVDFLELNVEGNFFANKPPPDQLDPTQFRGLFFPSAPETSVPRQGINADSAWRISDTTSFLSDAAWSMDAHELATASGGIAVSRDERLTYFLDDRYVQVLGSQVISLTSQYELSTKYILQLGQSLNFGDTHDVNTVFTLIRRFDAFSIAGTVFHDAVNNQSGFNINVIPLGVRGPSGGLAGLMAPQ
jgi:hypothetical protein